jgi:hypothetical protein
MNSSGSFACQLIVFKFFRDIWTYVQARSTMAMSVLLAQEPKWA